MLLGQACEKLFAPRQHSFFPEQSHVSEETHFVFLVLPNTCKPKLFESIFLHQNP